MTGQSASSTRDDYATVAYDAATGAQLWVKRYNGPGNGDDAAASSVSVSRDGTRLFVTGCSKGRTYDYATIAYNAATGARLWVRRYHGPGNNTDMASSLAMSPGLTKLFVTGYSKGTGTVDYATIAYRG